MCIDDKSSPAATLFSHGDLEDRIERGNIRHVMVDSAGADKFAEFKKLVSGIAVDDAVEG